MKSINIHIGITWLWANLLHPFVLFFYFGGSNVKVDADLFGSWMLTTLYTFLFSLPALFISWLAIYCIRRLDTLPGMKYILWLIGAPVIVIINFMLITFLFHYERTDLFELENAIPAMIAVVMVILLRYNSFFKALELIKGEA